MTKYEYHCELVNDALVEAHLNAWGGKGYRVVSIEKAQLPARSPTRYANAYLVVMERELDALYELPDERELKVLVLRNSGMTFKEIGKRLGISGTRANQIYHQCKADAS